MAKTAMDVALMTCKMPDCKTCRVKAKMQQQGTEKSSYTAKIRIVCPKCGKGSKWYEYDNYSCAIPELWDVLRNAFADFSHQGVI